MHSAPEKQTPNPAWAFNLDPVHSWAYWDKAFSKEECEKIIEIGNDRTAKEAKTRGEDTKVRKSEIAWLYPSDDLDWCYRRMTDIIMDLNNERFFQFDICSVRQRAFSSPSTPHQVVSTADILTQHPALLFANCLSRFSCLSLKTTRAVICVCIWVTRLR
jgi:hypothetical protein